MMCVFFSQKEAAISESETRSLPCVLFCAAIFFFSFSGKFRYICRRDDKARIVRNKGKKKKKKSRGSVVRGTTK